MIWNFFVSAVRIWTWNSWHFRTEDLAYAMDVLRQTLVPSPVETADPVDGYDGETGHAAMLLVVSIELGLSVGPERQWEMLQAGSKNTAFGSTSFLLCHAEKQDLHRFQNSYRRVTLCMRGKSKSIRRQALRLAFLLHLRSESIP